MSDLDNLEKLYRNILNIVNSGVEKIKDKTENDKELSPNDIKALESFDKVVRNALERFEKKPVVGKYTDLSEDDLLKELEENDGM